VYWQLTALGVTCEVVAPTLVPVKAGDRVKTDRRDALKLARSYRAGDLTPVWVPDAAHEALRDLVRAREAAKKDQLRARHRLGKFLLRHGRRPPTTMKAWTQAYVAWQIVGSTSAEFAQAVMWDRGSVIDLGMLPGGTSCAAHAINDRAQIVGSCDVPSGDGGAFLWEDGVMIPLGTLPGGNFSFATSINDFGQVVGAGTTASGESHAFLWEEGTMLDLGTLPTGTLSYAANINRHTVIVGSSNTTPSLAPSAVLWGLGR
jgi:probable HAF family extracellular repeat protein